MSASKQGRSKRAAAVSVNYKDASSSDEDMLSEDGNTAVNKSQNFHTLDSDNDVEDEGGEEEYIPAKPRLKSSMKRSDHKGVRNKKLNKKVAFGVSSKKLYQELEENLIENTIFKLLQEDTISVVEVASDWIDDYQDKYPLAMKNFINLILRACGCLSQVEEHDVANVDVAVNTVNEIQNVFGKQGMHQYPFLAKSKFGSIFRKNFIEFFGQVILLSNERNLLVLLEEDDADDDSELLEVILIWLSSLSTCNIRSLRYISSIILLKIETTICEILTKCVKNFDKNQTNYNAENSKLENTTRLLQNALTKSETTKYKRDLKKFEHHIKTIKQNMNFYSNVKNSLQEYLADIFDTVFIHRFKDVDPKIRIECIRSLYNWIEIYPQYFFDNSFLRYFGWLLFDDNTSVRIEVLKYLTKLYKKNNDIIISGLKQFTERFKSDIIKLFTNDNDYGVKSNCLGLLIEINRLGFLEDYEIFKINYMTFNILKNDKKDVMNEFDQVSEINKSLKDDAKLLNEMIQFMNFIQQEKLNELKEKFKLNIQKLEESKSDLNVHDIIKFKSLIKIIHMSKTFKHDSDSSELDFNQSVFENESFGSIAELYSIDEYSSNQYENILASSTLKKLFLLNEPSENNSFTYYFQLNEISLIGFLLYKNFPEYFGSWIFLLNYLTYDMSSIDKSIFNDNEYQKLFELSEIEEFFLLNLLYGVLYGVLTKKPLNYYIDDYFKKKRLSKKEVGMKKQAKLNTEKDIAAAANESKLESTKMNAVNEKQEPVLMLSDSEDEVGDATLLNINSEEQKLKAPENVLSRLINALPILYNKFEHIAYSFKIVFKIFINFLIKESSIFQSANEEALICEKLLKRSLVIFKEISNLTDGVDEISTLRVEFTRFFQLVYHSINLDKIPKEIKLLIQNLNIELFLELSETLNSSNKTAKNDLESAIDFVILISKNIQKILIVGQFFNISEYTTYSILVSLKEKIFDPLERSIGLVNLKVENSDEELFSRYFDLLLQFYLLFTSLKMLKLYEFAKSDKISLLSLGNNLNNQMEKGSSLEEYFKGLHLILEQSRSFIENEEDGKLCLTLRSKCFTFLANCLISFDLLKKNLLHNKKLEDYFTDFDSFLLNEDAYIKEMLTSTLFKASILSVFLHFENNVAILLNANIERTDEEDVNYGYVMYNKINEGSEEYKELLVSKEIELVTYTLKILDLRNLELIGKDDISRLYLNKEKLGPLYKSILDSKDNIDIYQVKNTNSENKVDLANQKLIIINLPKIEHQIVDSEDENNEDNDLIIDVDSQGISGVKRDKHKKVLVVDTDESEDSDDDPIVEDATQEDKNLSAKKGLKRKSNRSSKGSKVSSSEKDFPPKKRSRKSNHSNRNSRFSRFSNNSKNGEKSSRKLVNETLSSSDIDDEDSDIEFIS